MPERRLAVAFDTSSDMAGVALIEDGVLLAERTWHTDRNHSRELLPAIDSVLAVYGRSKEQIGALLV